MSLPIIILNKLYESNTCICFHSVSCFVYNLYIALEKLPLLFIIYYIMIIACVLCFQKEFRDHFRNITRIMDCVGCDKCKVWGKLQVSRC